VLSSLLLSALLAGAPPFDPDDVAPAPPPERAPELVLRPLRPGARAGRVWVDATPAALVLRGEVRGPPPAFAEREEDLAAAERVEISLAAGRDPALPPGPLRALFLRRWVLSGHFAAETLATDAYTSLANERPLRALEPRALPMMRAETDPASGWRFEIRVPWSALPPQDALAIRDLRLAVEVAGPGAARASTAPRLRPGVPATFPRVRLATPRTFRVTPCDEPLAGEDARGRPVPAWFVPPAEGDFVDEVIVVGGTRPFDSAPPPAALRSGRTGRGPGGPALEVEPRSYLDAGPDTWVCLPRVAVRRGRAVHRLGFTAGTEGVTVKRLAGGALRLVSGDHTLLAAPDWSRVEVFQRAPAGTGGADRPVRALCLHEGRYDACEPQRDRDDPAPASAPRRP
jgi:hypothetical protein